MKYGDDDEDEDDEDGCETIDDIDDCEKVSRHIVDNGEFKSITV